jgi:hypothetical protein
MVVYKDDCLISAKEDGIINKLVSNLSESFLLKDQGTVQYYLGIRIQTDVSTKTISMMQTGLIESIISDVGLTSNSNTKTTPSDSILYLNMNGTPRKETWNYWSIIHKLNFLAQNTLPDISFAVHQGAYFCQLPQPYMKWLLRDSFVTSSIRKIRPNLAFN